MTAQHVLAQYTCARALSSASAQSKARYVYTVHQGEGGERRRGERPPFPSPPSVRPRWKKGTTARVWRPPPPPRREATAAIAGGDRGGGGCVDRSWNQERATTDISGGGSGRATGMGVPPARAEDVERGRKKLCCIGPQSEAQAATASSSSSSSFPAPISLRKWKWSSSSLSPTRSQSSNAVPRAVFFPGGSASFGCVAELPLPSPLALPSSPTPQHLEQNHEWLMRRKVYSTAPSTATQEALWY